MREYLDLVTNVMMNGIDKKDRTGVGTRSIFGHQMRFDLKNGFPILTTKKMAWKSIVSELLWFLEGSSDERRLAEIHYERKRNSLINKKTIWTANANKQGKDLGYLNNDNIKELGPIYGRTWRNWNNKQIDQIENVIESIKNNPDSRRHIVSAWDVQNIKDMALPPCHTMFQFYVNNDELSCHLYQRSGDLALGVPFNISSYSLLVHMIARICNLYPGEFIHTLGDVHIYHNNFGGLQQQLLRKPKALPTLEMPSFSSLEELINTKVSEFILKDYVYDDHIYFDMAV